MIRNPILKVLSSMNKNGVKYLLMGGQACVLYGAAEFSRDTDLAILADSDNLARLRTALRGLNARRIAVPPFESKYLNMGLAVHFRCDTAAGDMRVDVMSKLRGVREFEHLWLGRSTVELENQCVEVMSLPDLVQAKKTQRDKDWPMLTRLVEANYFANRDEPTPEQAEFWLRELRTPQLLTDVARRFRELCERIEVDRPLLKLVRGDLDPLADAIKQEELSERDADRAYWEPLKKELERLRRDDRSS